MLYEIELGHNAMETIKNICWMNNKDTINYSSFKKLCSVCKKLDDQERSGRTKTVDSDGVLQARDATPECSTQR